MEELFILYQPKSSTHYMLGLVLVNTAKNMMWICSLSWSYSQSGDINSLENKKWHDEKKILIMAPSVIAKM